MSARCPFLSMPFQFPHSAIQAYSGCYFPVRCLRPRFYPALLGGCCSLLHRIRLDEDRCFHPLDRFRPDLEFPRHHHSTVLAGCCRVPTHFRLPRGQLPSRAPVHLPGSALILPLIALFPALAIVPLRMLPQSRLLRLRQQQLPRLPLQAQVWRLP